MIEDDEPVPALLVFSGAGHPASTMIAIGWAGFALLVVVAALLLSLLG